MIVQAVAAWAHFAAIFIAIAALAAELVLYRREITLPVARLLSRIDKFYGNASGLIVLTGLARVFWFAKGATFYGYNPMFWTKMGVFAVVGLLSIVPTVHFIRWRSGLAAGNAPVIADASYRRVWLIMRLEAALLLLLPLLAASMSRGIGM